MVRSHSNRQGGRHSHSTHHDDLEKRTNMERAVQLAAADFGFCCCPIFRVEVLLVDKTGVEIGPLRCYTKRADTKTILAASKKPTQRHRGAVNPNTLLPETEYTSWIWCEKELQDWELKDCIEIHPILTDRRVSLLSKTGRIRRL